MSDGSDGTKKTRKFVRTDVALLVQYRFNSFEDFLAEYAVNLSPGGMFIQTESPHELGALISLQFSLKDGSKLIEGMGRVVRVTRPGEGPMAGMGIEFVNFDEESSALIKQICDTQRARRR